MSEVWNEVVRYMFSVVLACVGALCLAGIKALLALARERAEKLEQETIRRAAEAAICWVEAHVKSDGPGKLRAAIEKVAELAGIDIDEAEIEAILARLKADRVIPE